MFYLKQINVITGGPLGAEGLGQLPPLIRRCQRGATSTFCWSLSGCWRCNENGRSRNA